MRAGGPQSQVARRAVVGGVRVPDRNGPRALRFRHASRHVCCGESRERRCMVRVRSPQDFWAGIVFILFGCAALWFSRDYAFGTLTKMGPGYLPAVLSWALVAIGGLLTAPVLRFATPPHERSQVVPQ